MMIQATVADQVFVVLEYSQDGKEYYPKSAHLSKRYAEISAEDFRGANPGKVYKVWPATVWINNK